jgi:hypothetical protein
VRARSILAVPPVSWKEEESQSAFEASAGRSGRMRLERDAPDSVVRLFNRVGCLRRPISRRRSGPRLLLVAQGRSERDASCRCCVSSWAIVRVSQRRRDRFVAEAIARDLGVRLSRTAPRSDPAPQPHEAKASTVAR